MYDTMVNMHSGPRMLGETFEMRAMPGNKNPMFDSLTAFTTGFGGDPNNYAKLNFYKGKLYENFRAFSVAIASTSTTTCWGMRTSSAGCRPP